MAVVTATGVDGECGCCCFCCECTCDEVLVTISNMEATIDSGSTWGDMDTILGGSWSWDDPDFRLNVNPLNPVCDWPSYNGGTGYDYATIRGVFEEFESTISFGQLPGSISPFLICGEEYFGCWQLYIPQNLYSGTSAALSYPNPDISGQSLSITCDPLTLVFTRAGFVSGMIGFRATVTITCNDP